MERIERSKRRKWFWFTRQKNFWGSFWFQKSFARSHIVKQLYEKCVGKIKSRKVRSLLSSDLATAGISYVTRFSNKKLNNWKIMSSVDVGISILKIEKIIKIAIRSISKKNLLVFIRQIILLNFSIFTHLWCKKAQYLYLISNTR